MSYDIYKKLMACSRSSDRRMDNKNTIKKTDLQANQIGKESQGTLYSTNDRKWEDLEYTLEALSLNYPLWTISLEEDNPFDGIGADNTFDSNEPDDGSFEGTNDGSDNPFGGGDEGNDTVSDDNGGGNNPFDFGGDSSGDDDFFSGGEDESNDFFGESGSDDGNNEKSKKKEIKLNRKEVLEQEFDINKQIRSVFPKRFLELQDVIKANISMCERVVIQDSSHIDVFDNLIEEYNRLAKIVDDYLAIIIEKPHDDIFTTYFTIFTNLSKLKDIYNDLVDNNEKNPK